MKDPMRPATVMTLTNELFLPTRLVYEVFDVAQLRAWLGQVPCISPAREPDHWTWDYEGAARNLGFPADYEKVPPERQPIVLASIHLKDNQTLHVHTRCGLRTVKFLVFFDQQVSRSVAVGKFIDQYNLLTTVQPSSPLPKPEDYFRDEAKIEFYDIIALMDRPDSPEKNRTLADHMAKMASRTIRPLERHRLEGFYHDGPSLMEQTMRFRDLLAGLQHQSKQPIRPADIISQMLKSGEIKMPR